LFICDLDCNLDFQPGYNKNYNGGYFMNSKTKTFGKRKEYYKHQFLVTEANKKRKQEKRMKHQEKLIGLS
jgi:hypothetical protein